MEKKEINELLKEWRQRVTYVRAEILADLRDAAKANTKTEVEYADLEDPSKGVTYRTIGEMEGPFFEARDRQVENESRIAEIEASLKKEGIDPFKASISSLLFVDTESSNCFNDVYKMCEYGHYATDASFNEIRNGRKDILINPGRDGRFNLVGRKGHRDLVLAHSHAKYKRSPQFDEFHNDISFFLGQQSALVFMWASENDIQALLDQCFRYRMTCPSFVSYDVQQIFMKKFPDFKGIPSLEKAAAFLGLSIEGITQHRPDEDAYITMMILKAIVGRTGKAVMELIRECPACQSESVREYKSMKRRHKENAARRAEINKRKAELAPYHEELNQLLSAPTPEGTPKEMLFAVSLEMKMHVDETLPTIKKWMERGFYLRRNLNVAYLVAYDEAERQYLLSILDTSELKVLLPNEFNEVTCPEG